MTPWTARHLVDPIAYKAPLSMRILSRQEYWSGLPFFSPRDLSDPGIEPRFPALQADILPSEPPGKLSMKKQENVIQCRKKTNKQKKTRISRLPHFNNTI